MSLLLIGIIVIPAIGLSREWANWPFFTVLLVAILFLYAGVRLQYGLLRAHFYFTYNSYDEKLLSLPSAPFKESTSFNLTVSNQENVERSISRIMLEIELENGDKKELPPMEPDCETKADITLYLRRREAKTVWLNFVYEVKPIAGSKKLYVFDDRGAWCRVPINVDMMITIAKKSKSRSGDYLPL